MAENYFHLGIAEKKQSMNLKLSFQVILMKSMNLIIHHTINQLNYLVTAGTIYMSLMGPQGIRETAITCHRRATELQQRLLQIDGVEEFFPGPFFHEFALRLPVPAVDVVQAMMTESVLPGLVLSDFSDGNLVDAEHGLLIAVTEKRTNAEIEKYVAVLTRVLQGNTSPANPQAGN